MSNAHQATTTSQQLALMLNEGLDPRSEAARAFLRKSPERKNFWKLLAWFVYGTAQLALIAYGLYKYDIRYLDIATQCAIHGIFFGNALFVLVVGMFTLDQYIYLQSMLRPLDKDGQRFVDSLQWKYCGLDVVLAKNRSLYNVDWYVAHEFMKRYRDRREAERH